MRETRSNKKPTDQWNRLVFPETDSNHSTNEWMRVVPAEIKSPGSSAVWVAVCIELNPGPHEWAPVLQRSARVHTHLRLITDHSKCHETSAVLNEYLYQRIKNKHAPFPNQPFLKTTLRKPLRKIKHTCVVYNELNSKIMQTLLNMSEMNQLSLFRSIQLSVDSLQFNNVWSSSIMKQVHLSSSTEDFMQRNSDQGCSRLIEPVPLNQ